MAYEHERKTELDKQLYEEDPAYEADTYFGERLNEPANDGTAMEADEQLEDDEPAEFGETLVTDPEVTTEADHEGAEAAESASEPADKQDQDSH
jgi:hypothetical protein